ncbi:MAG: GGDEF domain-containing protein [Candidatus Hydrogenedentes bacterium]|nr:GGDEF domain-containing protein [Candidatus Hydrogenedentota bacterium]
MTTDSKFYKEILDNLSDGVYFVDANRRITYWNRGAERIAGYLAREVTGRCCADSLLMHVDASGRQLCNSGCPLSETIKTGKTHSADVFLHHKDGHRVPVEVRISPILDEQGRPVGAVETFSDNSAKVASLERIQLLEQQALLCPLTKVGNRRYARMNLETRLDEYRRYGWRFGLLFVDVDHFKRFNDTYGHSAGDDVLKMVAKSLVSALRESDFVSRWGGEEFLITANNSDPDKLAAVAERCCAIIRSSVLERAGVRLRVTISVGATLAEPEDSLESILARADRLMYESKEAGRDRVTFDMGSAMAELAR